MWCIHYEILFYFGDNQRFPSVNQFGRRIDDLVGGYYNLIGANGATEKVEVKK